MGHSGGNTILRRIPTALLGFTIFGLLIAALANFDSVSRVFAADPSTLDSTAPTLPSVSIDSDSATNTATNEIAKVGDTVN